MREMLFRGKSTYNGKWIKGIVKELNLLPYQEYIVREMWESKSYLIPVRCSGWSYTRALLTVADILLRNR